MRTTHRKHEATPAPRGFADLARSVHADRRAIRTSMSEI